MQKETEQFAKAPRAFTLVELILVTDTVTLVMGVLVGLVRNDYGDFKFGSARSTLLQDGQAAIEQMVRILRQTTSFSAVSSPTDQAGNLTYSNVDGVAEQFRFNTLTIENSEVPVIETRNTETTLRVRDGQTIIIGGLRERQPSIQESKIPILGDISWIGALFRKIDTEMVESELGVFITPHIYTDGKLSAQDLKLLHSNDKKKSLFEASDILRLKPKDEQLPE